MKSFVAATIVTLSAGSVEAVEVNLQGVQHLQTVDVVYSGLEKGSEYFFTCYGYTEGSDIIATANGYAEGPVYSEELYFYTAVLAPSIVRVECTEN